YQKRKDEICPFSSLAFFQPTTVDKEPNFLNNSNPILLYSILFVSFLLRKIVSGTIGPIFSFASQGGSYPPK
ncbi:hypothetical protein, partial [Streptococcus pneumoniae]|uniref:hypothetical protein n=1 Tax=Streptococcus pneumoniae TaxID=1313 RepID=UPI00258CAD94